MIWKQTRCLVIYISKIDAFIGRMQFTKSNKHVNGHCFPRWQPNICISLLKYCGILHGRGNCLQIQAKSLPGHENKSFKIW
jgi:hypothetical protein